MPGRGCMARKAERRALRQQAAAAELAGLEPSAKALKLGADGTETSESSMRVPSMDELSEEDRAKAIELCRALFEACLGFGKEGCSVPQLGSHWKVQNIRKDKSFNHMRLADIIRRHTDVFEMEMQEGIPGGYTVKLQPGAMSALPGEGVIVAPESMHLPPLIVAPETPIDALQAMRIHTVHALFKRGGKAMLHDLGQEPKLLELRGPVLNGRSLLQLVRAFPGNFAIEDMGNGNFMINLKAVDVGDMSMLPALSFEFSTPGGNKGRDARKGKGGKKGEALMADGPVKAIMMMKGKIAAKGAGKGGDAGGKPIGPLMMMKGMMFAKGMMGKGGMAMDGMNALTDPGSLGVPGAADDWGGADMWSPDGGAMPFMDFDSLMQGLMNT